MGRCSSAVVKRSSSAGTNSVAVCIASPRLEKEAQEELLESWLVPSVQGGGGDGSVLTQQCSCVTQQDETLDKSRHQGIPWEAPAGGCLDTGTKWFRGSCCHGAVKPWDKRILQHGNVPEILRIFPLPRCCLCLGTIFKHLTCRPRGWSWERLPSVLFSKPFLRSLCLIFLQLARLGINMLFSETFGTSEFVLKCACGLNGRKRMSLDVCTKSG